MAAPGEHTLCEEDLVDDAEVDTLIREAVAQVMGESMFLHTKTSQWTANIVEGCLKRLAALSKPFKYVVTCMLGQKSGAGLHTASACRWEEPWDGKLAVQWENASTQVVVAAYWVAI